VYGQRKEELVSSISLGWGIVGTGRIAEGHIAPAIADLPGCTLAAVVNRARERRTIQVSS
jgi:predicted dehydrogenase